MHAVIFDIDGTLLDSYGADGALYIAAVESVLGRVRIREAPECRFIRERHGDQLDEVPTSESTWIHDARIKAAVVAAPAVSFTFTGGSLSHVKVPVQLWRAEEDRESPNQWNSDIVRDALPAPQDVHNVRGVGHFAFLAPCSEALAKAVPRICQDPPDFDRAAFHVEFNWLVVTFFSAKLAAYR